MCRRECISGVYCPDNERCQLHKCTTCNSLIEGTVAYVTALLPGEIFCSEQCLYDREMEFGEEIAVVGGGYLRRIPGPLQTLDQLHEELAEEHGLEQKKKPAVGAASFGGIKG